MARGKSALAKAAITHLISQWDGKKHTYLEFRTGLTKWATVNGVVWILNEGHALFNCMQSLQEEYKKKKKVFKVLFDDHNDSVWTEALESHKNCCMGA